jgi:hypothetical protein
MTVLFENYAAHANADGARKFPPVAASRHLDEFVHCQAGVNNGIRRTTWNILAAAIGKARFCAVHCAAGT